MPTACVGNAQSAERTGPEVRFVAIELRRIDRLRRRIAVARRRDFDVGKCGELFGVPGDEHGADAFDGNAGLRAVGAQQGVAAPHELRLQRAGLGIEAGMQDRGVRLAGPGADVAGGVEENAAQAVLGKLAGNGGTDDAGADDGDVVGDGRSCHARRVFNAEDAESA